MQINTLKAAQLPKLSTTGFSNVSTHVTPLAWNVRGAALTMCPWMGVPVQKGSMRVRMVFACPWTNAPVITMESTLNLASQSTSKMSTGKFLTVTQKYEVKYVLNTVQFKANT